MLPGLVPDTTINKPFKYHNDRLVNFIVCGAQKSGTNGMYAYLREHDQICMSETKEVHFFDTEEFFRDTIPDYSLYHASFNPGKSHKVIGEATPIYMYWYDAPRRIWEYNPNMKLIVLLRNPIDRAYSQWNMARFTGRENLSFWDAIQNEPDRSRDALPYQHRFYSYIDRGFYLEQIRRLWFYFSKNNVLILKYEYFKNQVQDALRDVCDFLEVGRFENIETKNVYALPYETKMSNQEKEYLRFVFEHEIRCIERALGWDCSDWLSE